ncbi:hypothetical protein QF026_001501 [Streptomyces aurantiacus]|nr:hypothetical protein [Streptomyces aurantiacus]
MPSPTSSERPHTTSHHPNWHDLRVEQVESRHGAVLGRGVVAVAVGREWYAGVTPETEAGWSQARGLPTPGTALHRPQFPQARRGIVAIDGAQDVQPVLTHPQHPGDQRVCATGKPVIAHRPAIPVCPVRSHESSQPSSPLQSTAQRLSDQLTPRFRRRTAASTWVESLRIRPRRLTRPASASRSTTSAMSQSTRSPSAARPRNSLRTVKSNPGSSSSRPRQHFQSRRQRTASAAWTSVRFSACAAPTREAAAPGGAGLEPARPHPREPGFHAERPGVRDRPSCAGEVPGGRAHRRHRVRCACRRPADHAIARVSARRGHLRAARSALQPVAHPFLPGRRGPSPVSDPQGDGRARE